MPTFRLDEQPWIPVIDTQGFEREVSLTEVFEQASKIETLSGNPLEVAVILRLLLAVAQLTETPQGLDHWKDLWQDRTGFLNQCAAYVRDQGDVWDLFHPEKPFLQDRRLAGVDHDGQIEAASREPVEPTFLNRGKVGTDPFVWHASAAALALGPAAAARALLVAHSFSVGGTGTPNPLIPRRKISKSGNRDVADKYSKSGLLAQSIVAFLHDSPLDRVLLLNLLTSVDASTPGWRFPPPNTADAVRCQCVADRYTRPAASVLLYPDRDGLVRSATVTSGATFVRPNPKVNEPGDAIDDPMLPHGDQLRQLELEPGKAMWRSAHTLLATTGRPLATVNQLQRMVRRGLIEDDDASTMRIRIVGICGDRGKVKHYFWRDEALPFGLSVIADDQRYAALERALVSSERVQQRLERRLREFARDYLGLNRNCESKGESDEVLGGLDRSVGDPDQESKLEGDSRVVTERIRCFLGDLVGFRKEKRGKDTITVLLFTDFWSAIGPVGERVACDDFRDRAEAVLKSFGTKAIKGEDDESVWEAVLKSAADDAFHRAIGRLPADARRYRAEFSHPASGRARSQTKSKGTTA